MRNTERAERGSRVRNRLVAASVALLVGVGGPVVVAAPAQAVTMVSITTSTGTVNRPVLKVGMKNIHVQWVQAKLGVKKTGYFGPLTQGAVKRYQASKGISATGVVARLTWTSLLKGSSAPAASVSGKFCPAPGAWLGSGWGDRRWHGPHQGIDMMGKRGDPLLAVEDGFVVRQGALANGQLRVVLQGVSGAKYYYGHNDRNLVTAGQRVEAGQRIATMGNTGTVAVHLHFEYWPTGQDRSAIDPRPLVTSLCR
jgi:murein DD-endopeptidase MepM/ murein hydrolase activator NlpD